MPRFLQFQRVLKGAVLAGVGALMLSQAGCYERVVKARGFGSDQYEVSEPYQENSKLDDWVFGERPSSNKSRLKQGDSR